MAPYKVITFMHFCIISRLRIIFLLSPFLFVNRYRLLPSSSISSSPSPLHLNHKFLLEQLSWFVGQFTSKIPTPSCCDKQKCAEMLILFL
ncbi:hypothetical protein MtrunA17_Chr7g0222811 [Medicago truncatula]|uniref:Uncharacterized protein n=1 Tax=Medicago truncatula TaxID=3880 RepID=A0A396GUD6_MEDTR|nr:hypothetical protein MtrunA17_Chr7g0222811 [Medicago truncatula]